MCVRIVIIAIYSQGLCCKTGSEFSAYYEALERYEDEKERYIYYVICIFIYGQ